MCLLSAIQMAAGFAMIYTGFGSTVGMALIAEGAADLFTAAKAYSTRSFTWSDYAKQKAVSVAISITCMGFSALSNVGNQSTK